MLTGEATEDIVGETSRAVGDAIHEHEETAELARNLFLGVTILFLAAWGVAAKIGPARRTTAASIGAVLVAVAYGVASVVLMNAGHQGGVLVHTHGIHAPLGSADPGAPAAGDGDHEHDELRGRRGRRRLIRAVSIAARAGGCGFFSAPNPILTLTGCSGSDIFVSPGPRTAPPPAGTALGRFPSDRTVLIPACPHG